MLRFAIITIVFLLATSGGIVFWAVRDAVSPEALSPEAILRFPEFASPSKQPPQLTVVSYNIGYASGDKNNQGAVLTPEEVQDNLDEIVTTLSDLQADIVCLQEIDFRASRTFKQDQLDYLARQLKMPYAAYVITWNKRYIAWPYWPPQKHFGAVVSGQAVLSRYPILSQDLLRFEKPTENEFWYNWFYLDRIAQRLKLRIGKQDLILWNLHLESFKKKTRLQQLDLLKDYITADKEEVPLIVAGDFNTPDLEGLIRPTGLHNAIQDGPYNTFSSWEPTESIDHITYRDLTMNAAGVSNGHTASDHLPVWARFK